MKENTVKISEIDYQPEIPPMGVVIQFPNKQTKKELKVPSMKCCKTDMIDWNFRGGF